MIIRNRRLSIVIGLGLIAWLTTCSPEDSASTNENKGPEQSELSELMRVMEHHGDAVKRALKAGDELPPRPEGISELLHAQPTEGMSINAETFPVFAKQYQEEIEALYSASAGNQEERYNAVIQSCKNCHSSHCPGPLMKINKMFVKAN